MDKTNEKILRSIKVLHEIFKIRYPDYKIFELMIDSNLDKGFCLVYNEMKIFYVKNIDVKIIKQYTKCKCEKLIIIYIESKTDCQYEEENVEIFSLSQLQYNIFDNSLLPLFQICKDTWYKGKYPKISNMDITCKMLGIKEGILKIIRDDGNGPYLYFREVV
jgi:DNA-directed RNA polymerase subunit H (RpoH/RPB5)